MEIVSIIISVIALVISGTPFYRKYMDKETELASIACDGLVRDNNIHIVIAYVNRNWQNAVITNCYLNLVTTQVSNPFAKKNHAHKCNPFTPIVLNERESISLKLEYSLLDLEETDFEDVSIYLNTDYVSCQGQRMSDSHKIADLCKNGINTLSVFVYSSTYILKNRMVGASISL